MFNQSPNIPTHIFCALLCISVSCQSKSLSPSSSEVMARPTAEHGVSESAHKKSDLSMKDKLDKPTKTQARQLFDKYIELGNNFDPSVVDLYAENSRTLVYRISDGHLVADLNNAKFREMMETAMPLGKLKDDRNLFTRIKITKQGEGFEVKAYRYSTMKCYTDKEYSMQMQPNVSGKLEIVREVMGYQKRSQCS